MPRRDEKIPEGTRISAIRCLTRLHASLDPASYINSNRDLRYSNGNIFSFVLFTRSVVLLNEFDSLWLEFKAIDLTDQLDLEDRRCWHESLIFLFDFDGEVMYYVLRNVFLVEFKRSETRN